VVDSIYSQDSKVSIDEGDRLKFAKQVLFWLGVICIGVFIGYGMYPDNKGINI